MDVKLTITATLKGVEADDAHKLKNEGWEDLLRIMSRQGIPIETKIELGGNKNESRENEKGKLGRPSKSARR